MRTQLTTALLLSITASLSAATFPSLAVSVNSAARRVPAGSPLIIAVTAVARDAEPPADIAVELVDAATGGKADLPVNKTTVSTEASVLDLRTRSTLWTVAPEATASATPGHYRVHVRSGDVEAPYAEFDLVRSEEHTSELQSHVNLVCRL